MSIEISPVPQSARGERPKASHCRPPMLVSRITSAYRKTLWLRFLRSRRNTSEPAPRFGEKRDVPVREPGVESSRFFHPIQCSLDLLAIVRGYIPLKTA